MVSETHLGCELFMYGSHAEVMLQEMQLGSPHIKADWKIKSITR